MSRINNHSKRYSEVIEQLKGRIEECRRVASTQVRVVGEALSNLEPEVFTQGATRDAWIRAITLRDKLPQERQRVRQILQQVKRNEELKTRAEAAGKTIADLRRGNEAVSEEVGRAIFAVHDSLPLPEEIDRVFQELVNRVAELTKVEREHQNILDTQDQGNVLKRLKEKGRAVYYQSTLAMKRKALSKNFCQAGLALCESVLDITIDDPDLKRILTPMLENKKEIDRQEKKLTGIKKEQESIWANLKELGAEKNHQRKLRELEKNIQGLELNLEEALEDLGRKYLEKPIKSLAENQEIKQGQILINQAKRDIGKYERQIIRVEAALRIIELDEEINDHTGRVEDLETRIKGLQEDIIAFQNQTARLRDDREQLLKTRGTEKTLFVIPLASTKEQPE